ncbi:YbaY family lipoprotein [Streptomyces sp. NPDC046866]|uniref:YbaY family lipoprotein n=1 Tax=Streptomyces sp. NPDC046866 TaxID=3154921 RepID=UPI0034558093
MTSEVTGWVVLPADAPAVACARVLVEVRDVSRADAPSTVVGSQLRTGVRLRPGGRLPFGVRVPDLDPARSYGLRVHIGFSAAGAVEPGDLLTTRSLPVVPGSADGLLAPVDRID